ncbi:SusD/RagB family nutrient-binding outer membrane lipoprotein [Mucilaginibacter sp. OK098]|uniref:SusD/RagB family nutrient-binding outer membrane lipoprotein n=1 Tax=Mucilaginibacter sp. OK098 TaxID=1855297 RepID=UPI00091F983A|nr:SusD/RagB family nutrient-binding outer membrane lipoprotein [Mucilaginibacter sp. OK098]SHL90295.1 Starch-binding associating with outer membrane [Mucilaginibacter sp. OK098]
MKLKYITILLSGALLLLVSSCKKDLVKINQNPNASQNAQPNYLLTAATKATADTYWGVANTMESSLLFVQYWAKIQYTDPDRYIYSNSAFQELWTVGYSKSIVNLNQIIKLGDAQSNSNYKGVALVLRSWVFTLLTDAYGDIPYKQATNIDQYLTPAYDTQKDVYYALLDDLKTAQAALDPAGKAIAGDVIYGNNIALWKKFANSLRLRITLRIADRDAVKAKQVLADIQSEGGAYISSNAEIAQLVYLDSPNQNPVSNLFDTRDDYRISKTIVDKLVSLNDPRLPVYASKTQDATPQTYVGIPNGLLVGDASSLGFTKTSRPGAYFLAPHAPAVIISYAEVLFDRAEAAARGLTAEDAASLYNQAVTASLNQYGIQGTAVDTYTALPAVKYDAANFKKSIGEQKWIALFGQGLEAFAEWRRLDYPQLQPAVAGTLNGKIPVRFIYPGTEQSLNGTNYKAAIADQGTDLLTTKLWFDVN